MSELRWSELADTLQPITYDGPDSPVEFDGEPDAKQALDDAYGTSPTVEVVKADVVEWAPYDLIVRVENPSTGDLVS